MASVLSCFRGSYRSMQPKDSMGTREIRQAQAWLVGSDKLKHPKASFDTLSTNCQETPLKMHQYSLILRWVKSLKYVRNGMLPRLDCSYCMRVSIGVDDLSSGDDHRRT